MIRSKRDPRANTLRIVRRKTALSLTSNTWRWLAKRALETKPVEMVGRLRPAVVLMDIHLGRVMDGIAATRLLVDHYPQVAVLGLSCDKREYVAAAMDGGWCEGGLEKSTFVGSYKVGLQ